MSRAAFGERVAQAAGDVYQGGRAPDTIVLDGSCFGVKGLPAIARAYKARLSPPSEAEKDRCVFIYTTEQMPSERFTILLHLLLADWGYGGQLNVGELLRRIGPHLDHGQEAYERLRPDKSDNSKTRWSHRISCSTLRGILERN
mmetsp:Transcript_7684/g.24294  ORF Transcript_7684/g.24294 Transcript_7684/m.24294 type:complete len:144 (-) Transcript_7684:315-746(-)